MGEENQNTAVSGDGEQSCEPEAKPTFPTAEFVFTLGIGAALIVAYAAPIYDQLSWYHRGLHGEHLDVPLDAFLLAMYLPFWVFLIAILVMLRARRRLLAGSTTIVAGAICWLMLGAGLGFAPAWFGYIERCQSQPEEQFAKLIAWADKIRPELKEYGRSQSWKDFDQMPKDIRVFCYGPHPDLYKKSRNQAVVISGTVFWEAMVHIEILPKPVPADFQFDRFGGRFLVHPQVVVVHH